MAISKSISGDSAFCRVARSPPTSNSEPPCAQADLVFNFAETGYDVAGIRITVATETGAAGIEAVRLLTGGSASSLEVSSAGYDSTGEYVATAYNSDDKPEAIATYRFGQFVQLQEIEYTDDYVSAVTTTDANDNATRLTYDEDGHKLTETAGYGSAGASTTTYTYTDGNLTSLVDPKGNETTFTYDDEGRQLTMTDEFGNTETRTYDSAGRLASILNRNGLLTTFAYNEDLTCFSEEYVRNQERHHHKMTFQDQIVDRGSVRFVSFFQS